MRKQQTLFKKIKIGRFRQRVAAIVVVSFMLIGSYVLIRVQAAAGYIYISPATATKNVGDTFSVQVRVRSTSAINAAFVDMSYNGIGLQVLSIQRGADFPNQNAPTQHTPSTTGNGTIKMQSIRNATTAGDFHYATITFRARTTGTYSLSPLSSSRLINYPNYEVSYTVARGDFTFVTPPAPTPPAPTPPQSPPQTPSQPAPSQPARPSTPTSRVPTTSSPPSPSNLQISNFAITEVGYRSATLTWQTNKPATSKVNYGSSPQDMPFEVSDQNKTTTHKLVVQGTAVRAGNKYAVRITSDEGAGPVTLDGEFSTKPIPIILKVVDSQGQAVAGATIELEDLQVTTANDGTVQVTVPEGAIYIRVTKDNLTTNTRAEVVVPESEVPQEISLTLEPAEANSSTVPTSKKRNIGIVALPVLAVILGGIAFVFWRRRRKFRKKHFPKLPSSSLPPSSPTHTPTLPELVRQDLAAKRAPTQPKEEPEDMFSALDHHAPPSIPPPIVPTEQHHAPAEPKPVEHHHTEHHKTHEPAAPAAPHTQEHHPEPEHPKKPHKDAEVDPKDHSLRIYHDK